MLIQNIGGILRWHAHVQSSGLDTVPQHLSAHLPTLEKNGGKKAESKKTERLGPNVQPLQQIQCLSSMTIGENSKVK